MIIGFAECGHVNCCDACCGASVNKRLDDWISVELMDLSRLEPPKKENKTPMKVMNGSRPSSPDREMVRSFQHKIPAFSD